MKMNAKTKRMLILGAIVLFILFPLLRMGYSLLIFLGKLVALLFIIGLVGRFLSDRGIHLPWKRQGRQKRIAQGRKRRS